MAFDPTKFKAPKVRRMPVILLLDVSGSMSGDKITRLNDAVHDMVESFTDDKLIEQEIIVAIFTFGSQFGLHTPYTPAAELKTKGISAFTAGGGTPLGEILEMAKAYIDDKETTKSSDFAPNVVLVSDGEPNNGWERAFNEFKNNGRSAKTMRISIPIGSDANITMMNEFASPDPEHPSNLLTFYAENAADIASSFNQVVMSVSTRSRLKDPNSVIVGAGNFDKTPGKSVSKSRFTNSNESDDDGDEI